MSEFEPTYRQHKILESVNPLDGKYMSGKEQNIELYWELVRIGYLMNLTIVGGDWKFVVTDKGLCYLADIANES